MVQNKQIRMDGIHSLSGFHLSRDITLAPQVTPPYGKGRPRIGLFQRNSPLYGLSVADKPR